MAEKSSIQWTEWDCKQESLPKKPGAYVFVGSNMRILYIGSAGNLQARWPLRRRGKNQGRFAHSALWYIAKLDGKGICLELPKPWPKNSSINGRIRIFYCMFGDVSDGSIVVRQKARKHLKRSYGGYYPEYALEQSLLVKHFLDVGHHPPLNAKAPSVRSVCEHWEWKADTKQGNSWRIWFERTCVGQRWSKLWSKLKSQASK